VEGTEWRDKVCLDDATCVTDFEFYLIEKQRFLKEPIDGFLGLGRSEPFNSGSLQKLNIKRGPSFLQALKKTGAITEEVFSLFLNKPD